MTLDKKEIFALAGSGLKESVTDLGMQAFRARQIEDWMYKKHVWQFADMKNISAKDRVELEERLSIMPAAINILDKQVSSDDLTQKLLLHLCDGNTVETVGMQHDYGNSVCVSSQVGCAMGCGFCASALSGFTRNLSAAELLSQAAFFHKEYKKLNNVIIMGSGEPFLNYDAVLEFVRILHEPVAYNMSYRSITISTCGIIPGIERLKDEKLPVSLAVSLHAPDDALRSKLMPVNKRYPIAGLVEAAADYAESTGRQVTFEYILIKNLNDSPCMAEKLAKLLKSKLFSVNIIPANPVPEKGWQRPECGAVNEFLHILTKQGVKATVRREMGADISAACGQLRSNYNNRSVENGFLG